MAFIFFVSSFSNPYQTLVPAPMQSPSGITIPGISAGQEALPNESAGQISHMGLYFILGILVSRALNHLGGIRFALVLTILYALSDEIHQFFVPGRAFQFADLILDAFGGLLGICIYFVFAKWLANGAAKISSQNFSK